MRRWPARPRPVVLVLLVVAAASLGGPPALADKADRVVTTTPQGVRVELERRFLVPMRRWWRSRRHHAAPPPPPCSLRALEDAPPKRILPASPLSRPRIFGPADADVTVRAFELRCGDRAGSVVLLPVSPAPSTGARAVAERVVREIPVPRARVGVDPDGAGLAGLESRVWLEDYDGTPVRATVEELGTRVDVEAWPSAVRFDFGDGSPPALLPAEAAFLSGPVVTHVYQRSSGIGPPYRLRADFVFDVAYRADDGPWILLPPIARSVVREYAVIQSRTQLARPQDR